MLSHLSQAGSCERAVCTREHLRFVMHTEVFREVLPSLVWCITPATTELRFAFVDDSMPFQSKSVQEYCATFFTCTRLAVVHTLMLLTCTFTMKHSLTKSNTTREHAMIKSAMQLHWSVAVMFLTTCDTHEFLEELLHGFSCQKFGVPGQQHSQLRSSEICLWLTYTAWYILNTFACENFVGPPYTPRCIFRRVSLENSSRTQCTLWQISIQHHTQLRPPEFCTRHTDWQRQVVFLVAPHPHKNSSFQLCIHNTDVLLSTQQKILTVLWYREINCGCVNNVARYKTIQRQFIISLQDYILMQSDTRQFNRNQVVWRVSGKKVAFLLLIVCLSSMQRDGAHGQNRSVWHMDKKM